LIIYNLFNKDYKKVKRFRFNNRKDLMIKILNLIIEKINKRKD